MIDGIDELIAEQRCPFNAQWVMPAYRGRSIINLMSSLLRHFAIDCGTPLAFHPQLAGCLRGKSKVVLLMLDGLGALNLQRALSLRPCLRDVVTPTASWPLTTISPSTTSTASASYLTALPPAAHGVLGFLMYFPEYGRVFNMLNFTSADSRHADLIACGFRPERYLPHPTVLQRLAYHGIFTGAYTFHAYAGSGLSRLLYESHLPYPYIGLGDMIWMLMEHLRTSGPQFHFVYWSTLDSIAHTYGADSPAYLNELTMLLTVVRQQLLPSLDQHTAFIISADHGHIDGDDADAILFTAIPDLMELFTVPPAGEGRLTQLYIRPGKIAHAQLLLQQAGNMLVMPRTDFLTSGLLGPEPYPDNTLQRLGDLSVFPYGSSRTLYPYEPRPHSSMVGRHGGLSPEEMLVPLLLWG